MSEESTVFALPLIQNIHGWSTQQVQTLQQQTAQAFGLAVEFSDRLKDGSQGPMMVVVPGGRFLMGSPEDEPGRSDDERQHEVEVKPFAIGKHTVTFDEYDRFAAATGRKKPSDSGWGRGRRPVIGVTWFDAVAYAKWLSQKTGQSYRLPTEAEWEYTCRAGTTAAYHFGASIQIKLATYTNKIKVVSDGSFFRKLFAGDQFITEGEKRTVEVEQYPANAWGLHDMHGNVWEWTGSQYDGSYGGAESRAVNDLNFEAQRVVRGGGWGSGPEYVRSAFRNVRAPGVAFGNLGFRLARAL